MNKKILFAVIGIIAVLMLFVGCKSEQPVSATTVVPNVQTPTQSNEDVISPNINVVGTGTIKVTPDIANVELGVVSKATTAAEAEQNNTKNVNDTINKLKELGIKEENIQTGQYYLNPDYDYSENGNGKIIGYTATTSLTVKVEDIKNAGKILDEAIKLGVNQSNGISFDISNKDAVYKDALKKAIENAKQNADAIAQASGVTIVRTLVIAEQGAAIPEPYAYRAAGATEAAAADTQMQVMPGQMEVTATVNVKYEIK